MNKALLIGRLTKDPELRATSTGRNVCQFSIAVNRNFTNANGEREADFINCVVWDKQAENVAKYLAKGRQVAVEGRIQTRSYDNNEGKKVYVTEVIANNVEFLGSGSSTNNDVQQNNPFNNAAPYEPTPFEQMPTESTSVSDDPFANFGEKIDISDNDLPF